MIESHLPIPAPISIADCSHQLLPISTLCVLYTQYHSFAIVPPFQTSENNEITSLISPPPQNLIPWTVEATRQRINRHKRLFRNVYANLLRPWKKSREHRCDIFLRVSNRTDRYKPILVPDVVRQSYFHRAAGFFSRVSPLPPPPPLSSSSFRSVSNVANFIVTIFNEKFKLGDRLTMNNSDAR